MSIEVLNLVLNHSRARGTAKVVMIGIANHDGDGGAWPAIATLAHYANVSERSVQRAIDELVEMGELAVHTQQGGTLATRNDRRTNRYDILVRPVDNSRHGVTHMSPRTSNGVTPVTPRGDTPDAHGVTPASPEPSLEPSINQGEATYVTTSSETVPVDNSSSEDVEGAPATPSPSSPVEDPGGVGVMRCPAHQGVEEPPPCRACRRARQRWEEHAAIKARERARAVRERERVERLAAEEARARRRADPKAQEQIRKAKAAARAAVRKVT